MVMDEVCVFAILLVIAGGVVGFIRYQREKKQSSRNEF
jgi:hypothetical protein